MPQFHINCKRRFDAYCQLLIKHNDKAGLEAAIALSNSCVDKCGYCEKPLNRKANRFRDKQGVKSLVGYGRKGLVPNHKGTI